MWWLYKLIKSDKSVYEYAYSRESNNLDGRLVYDSSTGDITVTKRESKDSKSVFCEEKAIEHFYTVIKNGLPEEYQVACG